MPVPHLPVSLKHAGRRLADKNDNDTKMHRLDHLRASAERSQTAQCKVSQNYTRWEITFGWPTSTEWLLAGRLVCSNSVICFNFEDFKHKVILQSLKHAVIHLNECTSNNPWQQWGGGSLLMLVRKEPSNTLTHAQASGWHYHAASLWHAGSPIKEVLCVCGSVLKSSELHT